MTDNLILQDQLSDSHIQCIIPFCAANFDVTTYSENVSQTSSVPLADQLSLIEESISALDNCIRNGVLDDSEKLISDIHALDSLEENLCELEMSSRLLLDLTTESYNELSTSLYNYSKQLDEACKVKAGLDLTRKSSKIISTARRIREAFEGTSTQWPKVVSAIRDIGNLHKSSILQSLPFLQEDLQLISQTSDQLELTLTETLKEAVSSQDMTEIGSIFEAALLHGSHNYQVKTLVDSLVKDVTSAMRDALDTSTLSRSESGDVGTKLPGRSTLPSLQTNPNLRNIFWTRLESIFEKIYKNQLKLELVESVFIRKHEEFYLYSTKPEQLDEGAISEEFFRRIVNALKQELENASKKSTFQQQILESEFPHLLKLLKDFITRLENATLFLDLSGELGQVSRNSVASFQDAFVSRSLSRLLDSVNSSFAPLPSLEELSSIMKVISSELSSSESDEILAALLCRNVEKTIRLMFVKLEGVISADGEATQVIGPLTTTQSKNFRIIEISDAVNRNMKSLLRTIDASVPKIGLSLIEQTLKDHEICINNVINPLFASLLDAVEAILLTMHQEDFSAGQNGEDERPLEMLESQCSLYMKELQDFLSRSHSTFFTHPAFSTSLGKESVVRLTRTILRSFVRHLMLVRPVGQIGRLKLAADCAQLEFALTPFNLHSSQYGRDLEILKQIRAMLFQSASEITENVSLRDVVPYSVALHLLFARAPDELKSPHQFLGWSTSRYSAYLEEHRDELERLALIGRALDEYAESVRKSGVEQYPDVYLIMKNLLKKALQYVQSGTL